MDYRGLGGCHDHHQNTSYALVNSFFRFVFLRDFLRGDLTGRLLTFNLQTTFPLACVMQMTPSPHTSRIASKRQALHWPPISSLIDTLEQLAIKHPVFLAPTMEMTVQKQDDNFLEIN